MDLKNPTPRAQKILKYSPVLLISLIAVAFAVVEGGWSTHPAPLLSDASLEKLDELNEDYQMVLHEDLLEESESRLIAQLSQAEIFLPPTEIPPTLQGLLLSVEGRHRDSILLITPEEELTELALQEMADLYEKKIPEFSSVEVDQNLVTTTIENVSPDTFVSIDSLPSEKKHNVRVAVIDSGVDTQHEIFDEDTLESGWNTLKNTNNVFDDVGHGTHIAGIIHQRAPEAVIIPFKIVDAKGGRVSNAIKAFDKALDLKVDIINTSFGVVDASDALKKVVDRAEDEGVFLVSAAGNFNSSKGFYPATYDSSIAVAGVDNRGNKMSKSNFGEWVDVSSYGTAVWSSLPRNDYGHKSGTSQATAVVTAALARLLMEEGSMDLEAALDELTENVSTVKTGSLAGVPIVK